MASVLALHIPCVRVFQISCWDRWMVRASLTNSPSRERRAASPPHSAPLWCSQRQHMLALSHENRRRVEGGGGLVADRRYPEIDTLVKVPGTRVWPSPPAGGYLMMRFV